MKLLYFILVFIFFGMSTSVAQEFSLYEQLSGRYDYLAFGNTMNLEENGANSACEILTTSSADFELQPGQTVVAAYLYWAGASVIGDFDVELNGNPISADRTFSLIAPSNGIDYQYFAAFADVTALVTAIGNTNYTFSEFDITDGLDFYCNGNRTNFGGWSITVIYEDATLPLRQVNIFDGLQSVNSKQNELTILLDDLNVIDNSGAKIGFLAWEGDSAIAINESLRINGNIISNPPLNPDNNAFNGTNSFTNAADLYNMDMDFYDIENNINPGDTQAVIDLTSNQDFVMINNVVTVLISQLPDATIDIHEIAYDPVCGNRTLNVKYTVFNTNSTDALPINTPIAFYANTTLIAQAATTIEIPIGGSNIGFITLNIPSQIPPDFTLTAVVDDDGTGVGIVSESNESNNSFMEAVSLLIFPEINNLQDLEICDAVGTETFNLFSAFTTNSENDIITFHTSEDDANQGIDEILDPLEYENISNPETIWVRVDNGDCFVIESFTIEITICPLPDATITLQEVADPCRLRAFTINYTVFNEGATNVLPAGTAIAFFAQNILIGAAATQNDIPEGASETGTITIDLPNNLPETFIFRAIIDDDGTGTGTVEELNEFNNEAAIVVTFATITPIQTLPPLIACNEGFMLGTFNLRNQDNLIATEEDAVISYFLSEEDAFNFTNEIEDPEQYNNTATPQTIYVRLDTSICFTVTSFQLLVENCPPFIPEGFSPNNDGVNDEFEITGLLNVFEKFDLKIYNRHGLLIYEGTQEQGFWDSIPNTGILYQETTVPTGLYFYVLQLNDPDFKKAFVGTVYVNY